MGMLHLPGTHVLFWCWCQAGWQVVEDLGSLYCEVWHSGGELPPLPSVRAVHWAYAPYESCIYLFDVEAALHTSSQSDAVVVRNVMCRDISITSPWRGLFNVSLRRHGLTSRILLEKNVRQKPECQTEEMFCFNDISPCCLLTERLKIDGSSEQTKQLSGLWWRVGLAAVPPENMSSGSTPGEEREGIHIP